MKRIAIIGGGASGMMAAISAAYADNSAGVFILEHKDILGKKILSTGNGRCNLTNMDMSLEYFRGEDTRIIEEILRQFDSTHTLEFFHSIGVLTKAKGSYVYPRSEQASDIRDSLEMEADRMHIERHMGVHVTALRKRAGGFVIETNARTYKADKVILACGSRAAGVTGSDGSGYTLAKSMGHTIVPVVPALVQLVARHSPLEKASGVRTEAKVTAVVDGIPAASDTGELQITAYGISGIPVFQISRYISRGLHDGKKTQVQIDFLPDMKLEKTEAFLLERAKKMQDRRAGDYLTGVFNKKLIPRLLELADIRLKTPVGNFSSGQIKKLSTVLRQTLLDIEDTKGFEQAQTCAGGVRTTEICPETMESLYVDGLYFAGEIMDIDGICGGYNLQAAWATGYIAGQKAAESA